jgi:hypothetical protein
MSSKVDVACRLSVEGTRGGEGRGSASMWSRSKSLWMIPASGLEPPHSRRSILFFFFFKKKRGIYCGESERAGDAR